MPARSPAQARLVHAKAAQGEAWAKRWLREYGNSVGLRKRIRKARART